PKYTKQLCGLLQIIYRGSLLSISNLLEHAFRYACRPNSSELSRHKWCDSVKIHQVEEKIPIDTRFHYLQYGVVLGGVLLTLAAGHEEFHLGPAASSFMS